MESSTLEEAADREAASSTGPLETPEAIEALVRKVIRQQEADRREAARRHLDHLEARPEFQEGVRDPKVAEALELMCRAADQGHTDVVLNWGEGQARDWGRARALEGLLRLRGFDVELVVPRASGRRAGLRVYLLRRGLCVQPTPAVGFEADSTPGHGSMP